MILAILNQKGGTGKTTTTVNVGSALATKGFKVLLIDMDPQGNLSYALGINEIGNDTSDVLKHDVSIFDSLVEREKMHILPTNIDLAKLELSQIDMSHPSDFLKRALVDTEKDFDFILIDCPPSLSWLTINALTAAQKVIIPMQLDVFSIQGLSQIIDTVADMKAKYNNSLEIAGVLAVMVDNRKKLTREVLNHVRQNFKVRVYENNIRTNVKAAEAPSFGTSVINYAPNSNSARDYIAATDEILETI